MPALFALIDCNNFYASCERLFQPRLRNRPVVVLSNNDGCIIARSNEAKKLGICMGGPYFKQKHVLRKNGVAVFSSNYALYGDLSCRVMSVLQQIEPDVEIYSIDEAFVRMQAQHGQSGTKQARQIKKMVDRWVGIPVAVGLGTTKTLAKLATRIAKNNDYGVFDLAHCADSQGVLASIAVDSVWGVGRRSAEKLKQIGVYTALDLKKSDQRQIRRRFGLSLARTVAELCGTSCISLEQCPPARKSIVSSRSFRRPLTELQDLQEAVSSYISIGSRKLRDQNLVAANLHVFLSTSRFRTDIKRFSGSRMVTLSRSTSNTSALIRAGMRELRLLYTKGYPYNKAGIMLTGLCRADICQPSLFQANNTDQQTALMEAMDQVNDRWGRDVVRYASSGLSRKWCMKQTRKSPAYTTKWQDLPLVRA